ncbi:MAG TPA: Mu transposase C-terminal domain-containing protein [Pyrinomonadaceae bacterium]|nr:Mu transposase C-terminal domain-containing protein [Pyrinomonadaceae bacterium]
MIVGSILEWQELEAGKSELRLDRVLRVNKPEDYVITIQINEDKAWILRRQYSEVSHAVSTGNVRVLETEIFPELLRAEKDIKPKHRARRDDLYTFLAPILNHDGDEYLLDRRKRGAKIKELALTQGKIKLAKKTIYKIYRRYLQRGCRPNALLSAYDKCGARGKRRVAQKSTLPKLGRPSALGKIAGHAIGIRITPEIERKLKRGTKRFLKDNVSLPDAYGLILSKYFYKELKIVDGKRETVLPPAEELPTFNQYRYWYERVYRGLDPVAEKIRRGGERSYNLESRETTGDPKALAFGPGSLYQIDATIADVHIVSSLDPLRVIGRPVAYACMDVFSHAGAGLSAILEGPSWLGAMLALDIVMADKVAFCAEYGIEIDVSQWPIHGFPQAICADRGEFEGFDATNLVKGLHTRVDSTAPYRADWKGLVERQFGLLNQRCVNFLPGRVRKLSRGEPDSRLDAVLTLNDFRQLLILYMLDYNTNFYLKNYRKDEFMIADHVERYPLDLWNWGVQNRGKCFSATTRDHVRLNLLPRRTVSVTGSGIHFEGDLYYTCDTALRENWFGRANLRGNWKMEVAFDPRTTDRVYLITDGGTKIEPCHLTDASRHLKGRDWHEVADYFETERQAKEAAQSRRQQSRANTHDKQDAIIGRAVERKEMALLGAGKISKSALISGMKENRAEEREREREADKWLLGAPGTIPASGAEAEDRTDEVEDAQSFAAPSMLDVLRQQREGRWRGGEDNNRAKESRNE